MKCEIQGMVLLSIMHQMTMSVIIEILNYFIKIMLGKNYLVLFVKYTDIKHLYPFQVIHSGFQVDHFIPKKIQLIEEYREVPLKMRE